MRCWSLLVAALRQAGPRRARQAGPRRARRAGPRRAGRGGADPRTIYLFDPVYLLLSPMLCFLTHHKLPVSRLGCQMYIHKRLWLAVILARSP